MRARWFRAVLAAAGRWVTRLRSGQTADGEADRRAVRSRARFWAELREGQHQAEMEARRLRPRS